jgi:hypothetical protein
VSQTDSDSPKTPPANDHAHASEERIRKVYAHDVKVGDVLHTVFRATKKDTHLSRGGRRFLAVTLVDRTGEVDARIFDNVEAADAAFKDDDFLLVQGKVGTFHGKSQLVVERLERLDPEPIDKREFAFVAPTAPSAAHSDDRAERHPRKADEPLRELKLPRRVQRLFENPQVAQAVDALLGALDRLVDERVAAKLGGAAPVEKATEPRAERKTRERGPRAEHRAGDHARHEPKKPEPRRDPTLPEGLAFKPFKQLVGEDQPAEVAPVAVAATEPAAPEAVANAEPTPG